MSYEKLRVYQAAEELRLEVDKLGKSLVPKFKPLYEHLDEAVDSISNNIAEGAESIYPGKRRSFYDIAANSTKEARRCIRSLDKRGGFRGAPAFRPVVLTLSIGKMLAALIASLPDK